MLRQKQQKQQQQQQVISELVTEDDDGGQSQCRPISRHHGYQTPLPGSQQRTASMTPPPTPRTVTDWAPVTVKDEPGTITTSSSTSSSSSSYVEASSVQGGSSPCLGYHCMYPSQQPWPSSTNWVCYDRYWSAAAGQWSNACPANELNVRRRPGYHHQRYRDDWDTPGDQSAVRLQSSSLSWYQQYCQSPLYT